MPDIAQQYKTIRTPDGTTHRFPSDATDDQINEALNPPPKVEAPPSAMSRLGEGYGSMTGGPIIDTAKSFIQHPINTTVNTLKNVSGFDQLQAAYNQAKQGNYGQAALTIGQQMQDPAHVQSGVVEPIRENIQRGNYAGALGQAAGVGTGLALGDYAPESRLRSAVRAAAKASGPDVGVGVLKAGAGAGVGYAMKEMGAPGWVSGYGGLHTAGPGLRQIGEGLAKGTKAFGEAWKGPVKPPGPEPPPIPTKGPSIGDLKSAAVNGTITPESFDAAIDKMTDLTFDKKTLAKADLRSSMMKTNPPAMGQPQKPLSLATMKDSVKAGENDIDWFRDKLKQQGHSDEGIELESAKLKREIETEKAKKEEDKKSEVSKPKVKPPAVRWSPRSEGKSPPKVEPPSKTEGPKVETPKVEPPKSSSIAEQLRDALAQSSPEAKINELGQVEFPDLKVKRIQDIVDELSKEKPPKKPGQQ